ncbi:MAG: polyphosphate polymerase domain-containing protein [Planctomycetota bacterium]
MTRFEIKLVAAEADLARVRAELRLLPTALRQLHPPRTVQSVYFDTREGQALADNLAGISERRKFRLRWYGEETTTVTGHFECKQRYSGLGDKQLFELAEPVRVAGNTRVQLGRDLQRLLPKAAAMHLDGREPAQWIRYHREYLGSADGALRVTIDRDLAAFDQRFDFLLSCRKRTPLPPLLVVEIKAAAEQREAIERFLQGVDLPPSKCSKFVLASMPSEAPLASGHFGA